MSHVPVIRILLIVVLLMLITEVPAQPGQGMSLELAGVGGLGSVNLDWKTRQVGPARIGLRTGFSYSPIDRNNGGALIFPVMVQAIWGQSPHRLETGIGQALTITTRGNGFVRMPLTLGYRFQPAERRFFISLAYTPLISWLFDRQWQHWAGIRFGYLWKTK